MGSEDTMAPEILEEKDYVKSGFKIDVYRYRSVPIDHSGYTNEIFRLVHFCFYDLDQFKININFPCVCILPNNLHAMMKPWDNTVPDGRRWAAPILQRF